MISDRSSRTRAVEFREEDGAGLLDLHSFDDTDLLFQDAMAERIESSPFIPFTETYAGTYDNDMDVLWSINKPSGTKQRIGTESSPMRAVLIDKESNGKDSGLARIKVVVRKRPLNKKEISRKEEDIISIDERGCSLTIHEPKLKVDLTAYVEKHDFVFDAVLSQHVTNDEVYSVTVEPIIPTIFQNTKATCFAFGQTGSGKTYTMQPLPLRACRDILNMMRHPSYKDQGLQLWFSFFEIYGGKLYDLLNDRRKLCMREDGRQQVCIVDLKEYPVSDLQFVKDYIEKGNATRSTGSTGANEESSRSHAILQLVLKKHHSSTSGKGERRGRLIGKFSFIDLAGSERGADTTDNDRQTRIEGAEINKSLLALKECIRALDLDQGHIPFRGSKLTEVLRDSFVGNSRTIMISCISPNSGSCEHTLNTLRYADRVKGLSKSSNARRDASPITTVAPSIGAPTQCHPSPSLLTPSEITMEWRNGESIRRRPEHGDFEDQPIASSHHIPQQRSFKDTTFDKRGSSSLKDQQGTDDKVSAYQRQPIYEESTVNMVQSRLKEPVDSSSLHNGYERQITAILEEEEDLISAHRLEVEDSMDLVQQEMKLLSEIDQPGSRIDRYVSQLIYALSRKAAGIVNLQARLTRFQQHLKEQEILSYNSG